MKKRIVIFAAALLTLMFTLGFSAFTASAEETSPSVSIEKFNLAFENDTHLKYAVKFTGIEDSEINYNNIGMLYWTDYEGGFTPGTESYSSKTTGYTTIDGQKYYAFEYDNLAAKQLTDYVYSVAYLEYGGETYYSEPVKYSALEYAYNRLGKTDEGTTNTELITILNNMLTYGASAQEYFDYKEDRLATADFYQLTLVGGTLTDGFTSGLYLATDEVTITAPTELDGNAFIAWQNSIGEIVSTDNPAIITNFTANETYTATYTETLTYSEGLAYTLNDDGESYSVTGIGTCTDTEIVIPSLYNSLPVTSIGDHAFEGCTSLTNIIIPDGITSIGMYALSSCGSLTSVVIPDSVTSIGDHAFFSSYSLASVVIGDSVTNIDMFAFCLCLSLSRITVSENNDVYKSVDGNLYTKDGETLIQYAVGKSDDEFVIPDSVTTIGLGSFSACFSLTCIVIPDSVTSIDNTAFAYCSSLTSIVIPDSVTIIGDHVFSGCSSLESIEIPDSITSIGSDAFEDCSSLTDVYYTGTEEEWVAISIGHSNDPLTNATRYYYSETEPTTEGNFWHYVDGVPTAWPVYVAPTYSEGLEYTLNEDGESYSVTGIGTCKDTEIVIPSSYNDLPVTSIGEEAFEKQTLIVSVVIPNTVITIEYGAFNDCTSLKNIAIPDSVIYVNNAFDGCTSLQYNEYGNALYLGNEGNPYHLLMKPVSTEITSCDINSDTKVVIEMAFSGCDSLVSVTVPASVVAMDFAFYRCNSIQNIVVDEANQFYKSIDGNLYTKDEKTLLNYAIGKNNESFEIPDSVTMVYPYAFMGCDTLINITIPSSVTQIWHATFMNCTSLANIVIPNSVTCIMEHAFYGCVSLKNIIMPNAITSIGYSAFDNCTALADIYYAGTEDSWNIISISNYNKPLTNATIHYNYVPEE